MNDTVYLVWQKDPIGRDPDRLIAAAGSPQTADRIVNFQPRDRFSTAMELIP